MRLLTIFFILTFSTILVNAQDFRKPFNKENFPIDKYQIHYKTYPFQNLTIEFTLVKEIKSNTPLSECNVFLNIIKGDSIIYGKSLGRTWAGGTFGIPENQPLEKYYIFAYFGEWHGEITLIDSSGIMTSFPGYHWALTTNKKYILTKANYPNSDLTVSKFNIESGELITKDWNIGLKGEPWKEINPSEYRGLEIVLCE